MAKVWVLDTETKGTGASMVPLEKTLERPSERPERPRPARKAPGGEPRRQRRRSEPERTSTPLPAGHVRSKTTGEIGRVQSVDARAGTASVRWLKRGGTSTVPLASLSRR
jgi:hypothetical protein